MSSVVVSVCAQCGVVVSVPSVVWPVRCGGECRHVQQVPSINLTTAALLYKL